MQLWLRGLGEVKFETQNSVNNLLVTLPVVVQHWALSQKKSAGSPSGFTNWGSSEVVDWFRGLKDSLQYLWGNLSTILLRVKTKNIGSPMPCHDLLRRLTNHVGISPQLQAITNENHHFSSGSGGGVLTTALTTEFQ